MQSSPPPGAKAPGVFSFANHMIANAAACAYMIGRCVKLEMSAHFA
jgi:hypothetical protein